MGPPVQTQRKKTRAEMSPMEQEIYDVSMKTQMFNVGPNPTFSSDYVSQVEAIKKKYEDIEKGGAPPVPPDLADAAAKMGQSLLKRRGMKNSRQASFLTGQSAEGTVLTHPDVLLRGQ